MNDVLQTNCRGYCEWEINLKKFATTNSFQLVQFGRTFYEMFSIISFTNVQEIE